MAKKKDKKAIEKRRAESKEKKSQTRTAKSRAGVSVQFIPRLPMGEIEAPEGFRPLSISQATMEYAKPIMEYAKGGGIEELNEIMNISMMLWNFTSKVSDRNVEQKSQIVEAIKTKFNMDDHAANELFDRMIERKDYLFPDDIQPTFPPTIMFIRKEMSHMIAPFNYAGLNLSTKPIPPDEPDRQAIDKLYKMDQYVLNGTDYDEWEEFFFSMQEAIIERYQNWLISKGATEHSQNLAHNIEFFLDFIYRYTHEDVITPSRIHPMYFFQFFEDFILRKLMTEPQYYVTCPPSLKCFYILLQEKGYIGDCERIIKVIDGIEQRFIDILRRQFG